MPASWAATITEISGRLSSSTKKWALSSQISWEGPGLLNVWVCSPHPAIIFFLLQHVVPIALLRLVSSLYPIVWKKNICNSQTLAWFSFCFFYHCICLLLYILFNSVFAQSYPFPTLVLSLFLFALFWYFQCLTPPCISYSFPLFQPSATLPALGDSCGAGHPASLSLAFRDMV